MTLSWIYEDAEEHHGAFADRAGDAAGPGDGTTTGGSKARLIWTRTEDIPPQPQEPPNGYSQSPRELFIAHQRTLWHITATENLAGIVKEHAILCDDRQRKKGIRSVRAIALGDIIRTVPIRGYVSLGIAYRYMMREVVNRPSGAPAMAMINVSLEVLDYEGARRMPLFFPGWPDSRDIADLSDTVGLGDTRGATWVLTAAGDPRPGGSVFVPGYVALTDIEAVHLVDASQDEEEAVRKLAWPDDVKVELVESAQWMS